MFHLALLLCARQVVKRREGRERARGREGGRVEKRGRVREKEEEKDGERKKGAETVPGCPSAVSQNNTQDLLVGIMCLSVQLWQRQPTHCDT